MHHKVVGKNALRGVIQQCSDPADGISCHVTLFMIQYTNVVKQHQAL